MEPSIVEPKVKGVAFRTVDACYRELRGDELHARARELMLPELQRAYGDGLILPASWYPIAWYRDLFRAMRAASGDGLDLARQIGFQSVKRDMASTYKRIFAHIVSPQLLLSFSSRLFNTYYDTGKFEVVESHKGTVRARFSGCLGWDANMWAEMYGASLSLLETAGAKEVRLRVRSGGRDNDSEMDLEAHWV